MAVILVVEDDAFIMQSLGWMLEDLGHNMLSAHDPGAAMAQLAAKQLIDALFVDIRLGNLVLGGYDVANRAIDLRPDLPVLYTSGSQLTAEMTGRFVPGGRFLQKPYSPVHVEASIAAIFN
ncbi:MAG: hypothetical protein RL490_739 [Pseudomonadota bacterium]|jgi:CheY-like chemotaxis protein